MHNPFALHPAQYINHPCHVERIKVENYLSLSHNGLSSGIPVPEEDCAVFTPTNDVAVRGVVALVPGQAGYHSVVTIYNLANLSSFSRKHP